MSLLHDQVGSTADNFGSFFVGGEWVPASSDKILEVVSPASEEVVFKVAEGVEADVDKAVSAARDAFDNGPWPRMTPHERAAYLTKWADLLRARAADLGQAWIGEIGVMAAVAERAVPIGIAPLDRAVADAENFEFLQKRESAAVDTAYVAFEPVGVVACIAPWNVPVVTILNKAAPALLAGCTIIMKPAPQTPVEAFILAETAAQAGFPPGVINMVTAEREASDYLVRQEGVDKVAFTGSLAAGEHIAGVCGQRMARVTLELGGKSAAIILEDYNLETVATGLSQHICMLSGQNCAALTRVLIPGNLHDQFVALFAEKLSALKVGEPSDAQANLGPLAMKRQLEQVERYVAKGVEEGASLICGGKRPAHLDLGYYFEPTLFANVDNSMTIAQEEIFGPVFCVIPYDDVDQAIEIANDSPFGLAGTVYTDDAQQAYDIARRVRSGTIAQNGPFVDFSLGFGGFKRSGLGREGGLEGLKAFLEPKVILLAGDVKTA